MPINSTTNLISYSLYTARRRKNGGDLLAGNNSLQKTLTDLNEFKRSLPGKQFFS